MEVVELCPLVGDPTVTLRTLFERCPNLAKLDFIVGTHIEGSPPVVRPFLCTHFFGLIKLKVISMVGDGLTSSALHNLFMYCTNLRDIHINHCDNANDETIKVMIQNCRNLDAFCLEDCKNITHVGMLEVATYCTKLTKLKFMDMPISDEVLVQLSRTCLSLTSLSLYQCEVGSITEAGVRAVLKGCTCMTYITIVANILMPVISTLDLPTLKQSYPHVTIEIMG